MKAWYLLADQVGNSGATMDATSMRDYTFASFFGFSGGHPISGRNVPDIFAIFGKG